jgi:hypothetical protein
MARYKCDRDLLIPKVQVNHSVTGTPKRSIGKQHITGQSAELGPKNAVRLMAVLEHTLPSSQPTIESKNELRPRWPLVAVCSSDPLADRGGESRTHKLDHVGEGEAVRLHDGFQHAKRAAAGDQFQHAMAVGLGLALAAAGGAAGSGQHGARW